METLRIPYKSVNGVDIPTDVHLPDPKLKARNGLSPVLIMIHGGGFVLGFSRMNNMDQIQDCLNRGWIVLFIEYRLCPGVNVLEGPMRDSRDVLRWAQDGGLSTALRQANSPVQADPDRVMAMGASAGGHLALCMGWNVEEPPIAILDFYGPTNFQNQFWLQHIEQIKSILPPLPPASEYESLYQQKEVFLGGLSLEGQTGQAEENVESEIDRLRKSFAMQAVANGRVLQSIWPPFPNKLELVDPALNVHRTWPPTAIVHGNQDFMVPLQLSKDFESILKESKIEVEFFEVEGEPHVGNQLRQWRSVKRHINSQSATHHMAYRKGEI